ncbi:unnamed protein product [Prunus armeniaca]
MPPPPVATCLAFHPRDDSIVAIGMDNSTIKPAQLLFLSYLVCTGSSDLSPSGKIVASYGFSFCFQPKVLSLILIEHGIRAPGLIPERGVSCEREVFPEIPKRDKGCSFIVWFTETHIKMVGSGSSGGDLRTPQFDGANYDLRTPQFHVIETLFIDHVCEWQDCLSLSLSTGNSLQVTYVLMRSLREQYLSMLQRAEVKSTVTDPGQSHMSTVAIPNGLPTTVALTLNESSSPMSTDFHPIWQTILLFGTCVGDIGPPWDVSSGEKLLLRNFRVWNLDIGPMALKFIFSAVVFFIEQGLHMQSTLWNYILIMEATTFL